MSVTRAEKRVVAALRQDIMDRLDEALAPLLHESGWVDPTDSTGHLWVYVPYPKRLDTYSVKVKGYFLDEIDGFCRGGVITDIYCAAMCVGWEEIPLEDLIKLLPIVERFVKLEAKRKEKKR